MKRDIDGVAFEFHPARWIEGDPLGQRGYVKLFTVYDNVRNSEPLLEWVTTARTADELVGEMSTREEDKALYNILGDGSI